MTAPTKALIEYLRKIDLELEDDWLRQMVQEFAQAVIVRAAELLRARTGDAPVFVSANLDGGDARNQRWLEHYAGRLTYM